MNKYNEFVVFDIGSRYIKSVLVRTDWKGDLEYVYSDRNVSKGISDGNITNLRSLSDAIFQSIYNIEIDVGTVVKSVVIVFSFSKFENKQFKSSLNINGVVQENHIQNLNYRMNLGVDQTTIGHFYKYYKLDNLEKIENPDQMCGSLLTLEAKFMLINSALIRNIVTSFNRNSIEVNYIGFGNLISHINYPDDDLVTVDVGFNSTRVFTKIKNNTMDLYQLEVGFSDLLTIIQNNLNISLDDAEKEISLLFSEKNKATVDLCREFFRDLFRLIIEKQKNYDFFLKSSMTIYLTGGIVTIPLIDLFLQQTFDLNFIIPKTVQNLSSNFNKSIFQNCIAISEYLVKHEKKDFIFHLE